MRAQLALETLAAQLYESHQRMLCKPANEQNFGWASLQKHERDVWRHQAVKLCAEASAFQQGNQQT